MNLVLLGPPGSGKGTQAKKIFEKYNLIHISTGDTFRELLRTDSPMAKEVKKYIEQGLLVPDNVVMKVVKDQFKQKVCTKKNDFLLDGFPRNLAQVEFLDKYLIQIGRNIDKVIYLEVSNEIIINRLSARRMCRLCGANYNLISQPPESNEKCDSCSTKLVQRKDDTPDVVKQRLEIYRNKTYPLSEYYIKKNLLIKINAGKSIEKVFKDICNAVDN